MGIILFFAGILGLAVCIVLLLLLPKIYEKQKKKLLKEINEEA